MDTNFKEQALEAFNTIRTNLSFLSVDRQMKILMITSSIKGEGKSTVSANIANSIANTQTRVLLIDADLRNPTVHRMFGIPNRKGLSDIILSSGKNDNEYACMVKQKNNLDIITAGHRPPNPTELLASKRMSKIIQDLSQHYDYILIDTPPVLVVPDAMALYSKVDGMILVSRHGYTTKEALANTRSALDVANATPVACVMNAIPDMQKAYSYYGYYDYTETDGRRKRNGSKKKIMVEPVQEKEVRTPDSQRHKSAEFQDLDLKIPVKETDKQEVPVRRKIKY